MKIQEMEVAGRKIFYTNYPKRKFQYRVWYDQPPTVVRISGFENQKFLVDSDSPLYQSGEDRVLEHSSTVQAENEAQLLQVVEELLTEKQPPLTIHEVRSERARIFAKIEFLRHTDYSLTEVQRAQLTDFLNRLRGITDGLTTAPDVADVEADFSWPAPPTWLLSHLQSGASNLGLSYGRRVNEA